MFRLAVVAVLFSVVVALGAGGAKAQDPAADAKALIESLEKEFPSAAAPPKKTTTPTEPGPATGEPRIPSLSTLPKPNSGASARHEAEPSSSGKYQALMAGITIFVLAVFVGFEVITKVPPTLHTPLMSGSNAISGITIVGAIILAGSSLSHAGSDETSFWRVIATLAGMLAIAFAMTNVVGGFLVTHRMLGMFQK